MPVLDIVVLSTQTLLDDPSTSPPFCFDWRHYPTEAWPISICLLGLAGSPFENSRLGLPTYSLPRAPFSGCLIPRRNIGVILRFPNPPVGDPFRFCAAAQLFVQEAVIVQSPPQGRGRIASSDAIRVRGSRPLVVRRPLTRRASDDARRPPIKSGAGSLPCGER
jgi:hypothetical protein